MKRNLTLTVVRMLSFSYPALSSGALVAPLRVSVYCFGKGYPSFYPTEAPVSFFSRLHVNR